MRDDVSDITNSISSLRKLSKNENQIITKRYLSAFEKTIDKTYIDGSCEMLIRRSIDK